MNFTDPLFWIIVTPLIVLYWFLPTSIRRIYLLFISFTFYASWQVWYLVPLLMSATVDYFCGFYIEKNREKISKRKLGLAISIFFNMGLLILFKIVNKSFEVMGSEVHFGVNSGESLQNIIFPVGISFYTFQTMSYSWDIYRGRLRPEKNFISFLLYVSFFPQLMAGPIERARRLLPQFINSKNRITCNEIELGTGLIFIGLLKKVFVSSLLIQFLINFQQQEVGFLIVGTLMTFIVYYDFAGYSDMARGLAKLFGINIMINFKPFYFSKSPREFWETWNRSLTAWIRDYLFLSLKSESKIAIIVQTFLFLILIGLWHDISWNWLVFGIFHAIAILLHRFLSPFYPKGLWPLSYLLMFIFYSLAGSLHLNHDFSWVYNPMNLKMEFLLPQGLNGVNLIILIPLFLFEWYQKVSNNYDFWCEKSYSLKCILFFYLIIGVWFGFQLKQYGFIYFMF